MERNVADRGQPRSSKKNNNSGIYGESIIPYTLHTQVTCHTIHTKLPCHQASAKKQPRQGNSQETQWRSFSSWNGVRIPTTVISINTCHDFLRNPIMNCVLRHTVYVQICAPHHCSLSLTQLFVHVASCHSNADGQNLIHCNFNC